MRRSPEVCPNCGAEVPAGARACPECGADESTGWAEGAYAGAIGAEEEDFDYEDFVKREFGGGSSGNSPKPRGISWVWWVVAVLVLAAFLFTWVL
jgi:hypothetical protein